MSSGADPDIVTRRLHEAESRRAEAERAHNDALAQLRSAGARQLDSHTVQQLQSRARELEKKAALETVKCEELQLELSAALRMRGSGPVRSGASTQSVSWAPIPTSAPASEIERIMAKIEQDNRILAELDHTRSTTHGLQSSGSGQGFGEYHSPSHSPLSHLGPSSSHSAVICQSSTMPTLSSLHGHQQTSTMPSSNSVAYSIGVGPVLNSSSYNPSAFTNPSYSSTAYNLSNSHQVTFSNPVTAPLANNISQISSTLAGIQSNLQGISSNVPSLGMSSGYTGQLSSSLPLGSGLTGGLGVTTSLSSGLGTTYTSGLSNPLSGLGGTTQLSSLGTSLSNQLSNTNPLSSSLLPSSLNMKLKTSDEVDFGLTRYALGQTGQRVGTPVTPHQPSWNLGLESQYQDALVPMSHSANSRALARINPNMDLDIHSNFLNGGGGMIPEGQVDMLDIPGKGRCCVYIARFSYDPPEMESAEGELSISAGDYLLVWGPPDPTATLLDAELLDGRRGLVPANFVQRLVGDDLLEFHQAVVSTLRDADETAATAISDLSISRDVARLSEMADISEGPEDDDNIPAPRQLTLERQLNKSVLIGWTAPEGAHQAAIESYHVYVDGVLKTTVKATERTRALVEGVDATRPHRISVRSVTVSRRTSRDAACTMVIGRDTSTLGPTCVRASNVTCSQAVISWLPANSNHQHVVCVNNVEVRTVKPGVYKHTITGLAPSTQYRVTVRAKHLRAGPPPGAPIEEAPGAYTDFRTLPKGLPDPPLDIQLEAGPQDGTLLVTWQPVSRPPTSGPVTGYAVYADGKKVTDVDSPSGDHALIDIGKLLGLNPRCITVRTKSRDSQSSDSVPTPIPPAVLRGVTTRMTQRNNPNFAQRGPIQQTMQGRPGPYTHQQQQQVIDHEENLSDKEIYPTGNRHDQTGAQQTSGFGTGLLKSIFDKITPSQTAIPAIEITKESMAGTSGEMGSEDELDSGGRRRGHNIQQPPQQQSMQQQQSGQQYQNTRDYHGNQQLPYAPQQSQGTYGNNQQQQQNQLIRSQQDRNRTINAQQQQQQLSQSNNMAYNNARMPRVGGVGPRMPPMQQQGAFNKKCRFFVALFDYDPTNMSPNPDGVEEELPFNEGDTIKVYGEKDPDGFYWGECHGKKGFVPENMVVEVEGGDTQMQGGQNAPGVAPHSTGRHRERWNDAYSTMPVRRMVALYDYDPQELSPNVDADMELSFQTGQIINVYGDMDDDGFFMGEIDGVRGLVPSNFLADANDQYDRQGMVNRGASVRGRSAGPGARGPPPPPRDNLSQSQMRDQQQHQQQSQQQRQSHRKADACPLPLSQLDHNTSASNQEQANSQVARQRSAIGAAATAAVTTNAGNTAIGMGNVITTVGNVPTPPSLSSPLTSIPAASPRRAVGPTVLPTTTAIQPAVATPQPMQPQGQQQQPQANLMQKFTEITAPGGDILSKGKELIFMKFGLGGK